ncbi:hypothetical protein, partial [Streptomyces virginiae]
MRLPAQTAGSPKVAAAPAAATATGSSAAPHGGIEDRIARFATIWGRAIFPVTATSLTRTEFERHLVPL